MEGKNSYLFFPAQFFPKKNVSHLLMGGSNSKSHLTIYNHSLLVYLLKADCITLLQKSDLLVASLIPRNFF